MAGFAVISGLFTGVLWAYANPIQLVPGIIQWRIFACIPPVIGILVSPWAGFISGYIGVITWSFLAQTFLPFHTFAIDAVMVGFTGFLPGFTTRRKYTLAQLAIASPALIYATLMAAGATVLMVIVVALSYFLQGIYPLGWAVLWIGLANLVPVVLGTPFASRYGARMIQTRLSSHRPSSHKS